MIRSLTEIQAQVLKAARGAGMPLGHAEDFAQAARFIAATTPQHLDAVSLALKSPTTSPVCNVDTIANATAAMAGAYAIDLVLCGAKKITLQDLDAPAVFHAMVALACDRRNLKATVLHSGANVHLVATEETIDIPQGTGPADVSDQNWAVWDRFASETYVPATEASRLAGAGAGLTDND